MGILAGMVDSPRRRLKVLKSVDAVLDALGGNMPVAALVGVGSRAVSNWRARQRISKDSFLVMRDALLERGATAPPSLWGIKPPGNQKR